VPQAFPAVYSWMTYPLTVLLEAIWDEGCSTEDSPGIKAVELCSVVERSLNFLHTGNTAVLLTRLMTPLWTSLGLLRDGWPCFNPELVHFGDGKRVGWKIKQWPFYKKTRRPISAAYAGQSFYHGTSHAEVRHCIPCLQQPSHLTLRARHTWHW